VNDADRKRALELARHAVADATAPVEMRLISTALLAMYDFGRERLAPVYHHALQLVRDDGSQDAKAWFAFKDVVLRCRAYDSRTIEPHEPQTGAGR
jgi:hypothetical protein